MSSDEKIETRDESDVEAHKYVTEAPGDDDPERKRKRKEYEEPAELEGDEFGRRKK